MEVLKTVDLTKIYGYGENKVLALKNANLEVKQGEFIAILGTSGSGKSTFLNLIGGLDTPTKGEIFVIAIVFLIISLFHIVNTMNHLILSRRHEYGILRAMGITNKNFRKLMLGQGAMYGIFSSIVMIVLYIIGNRIMEYLMGHVYGFLVSNIQVNLWLIVVTVCINICIGICAVLIPTRSILKEDIIQQVNLM